MTNTICGHDREVLIWALRTELSPIMFELVEKWNNDAGKRNAVEATHDPAKIAEMLAHEGRRLGIECQGDIDLGQFPIPVMLVRDQGTWVELIREWHDMSQARAILSAWLQLPDGANEDAMNALRESNE